MWRRWVASAAMYVVGETAGAYMDERSPEPLRLLSVAATGATADSVVLRAFHFAVEKRLPTPLLRTLAEQALYAPMSNAGYLTLAHGGWHWTRQEYAQLYLRDCSFWTGVSFIGYKFVPLHIRYLYVSGATLVWNSWRSSLVVTKKSSEDDKNEI